MVFSTFRWRGGAITSLCEAFHDPRHKGGGKKAA
jgi:hypothetical protein